MKKLATIAIALLVTPLIACSQTTSAADATNAPKKAESKAIVSTAIDADASERIRSNLQSRLPQFPAIETVNNTSMPGLYEVQVEGPAIFYTDAQGDFLIQGAMFDTQNKRNLTEERMQALTAITFDKMPLKDAIVIKQGSGKRKLAVFSDPNCHYCKKFEAELAKVKDITVYVFLYPILGQDSVEKAQNIWCAKNRAKAWKSWMFDATVPPAAQCDIKALQRNMAFGRQQRITGTPTLVFANGKRVSGTMSAEALEGLLNESHASNE